MRQFATVVAWRVQPAPVGMNHATLVSLCAMVASLVAAAVGVRLRKAAGWRDQSPFGWAALTAALYSVANLPSTAGPWLSDAAVVHATRLQLAVATLHAVAWLRFADNTLGPLPRASIWLQRILIAVGLLFTVPGVAFRDRVTEWTVPWAESSYRLVEPGPAGAPFVLLLVAVFALLAGRYVLAWRGGRRDAAPLAIAFSGFFVAVGNDAAVLAGLLPTPFLIEVGLFLPLGVAAWGLGTRFIAEAHELARLRDRLEELVAERTRDLDRAHETLRRAERLATLGQLAAGVAHEVNNPAAVVTGNLEYLRTWLRKGELPTDVELCVDESLRATWRIAGIVRQLLSAGRAAGGPGPVRPVPIGPVVLEATRCAQRAGSHVVVDVDVPIHLKALGDEGLLLQILSNLIVNAVQAIPGERHDGRVAVSAAHRGERVRIEVQDNGSGMSLEVLERAFDPFFSTKAPGEGTGLGLAISRGLAGSLGGELRLESVPGHGTCAVLELPGLPPHHAAFHPAGARVLS